MLKNFVDIILLSKHRIESGTLYCEGISVNDQIVIDCIDLLNSINVIENTNYINKIGQSIDLELTLVRLNAFGFYETCDIFILRNKYSEPNILYYIYELNSYSIDNHKFVVNYRSILNLIESVEYISKHTYIDTDLKTAIIVSEDQSLLLPVAYNVDVCNIIEGNWLVKISETIIVFKEPVSEKKLLFLNQFIAFLKPVTENERFVFLIKHVVSYYEKSISSYQYYLRDFSYNKLKVELDSKALEFAQKIQSVINDSQSKLIAIPTAFVLVIATFDFEKILSSKNIGAIISLFIFSILIQIFLNNQRSALKFIKQNINAYKETFVGNDIEQITSCFALVEVEFGKQDLRLKIVEVILWAIPVGMFCFTIYLLYHFESIIFIYLVIIVTHAFFRVKWDNK
ncbi:MAG: hypothetical protein ABI723_20310 [Bacteroidia bacterium]